MKLEGPVDFRHTYVDMSNVMVQINQTTKVGDMWDMHRSKIHISGFEPIIKFNVFTIINFELNQQVKTCKPAMGFSFAAGTTDGPGAFNFTQGICCSHFLSIYAVLM